jgi:hypothetical protein
MSDTSLIIAEIEILQDAHGRYSLNTLHKASGGRESKKPSNWLALVGTKELIAELDTQRQIPTFDVVKGGNAAGTYVDELLAISYAGWISPAFQLKVNQVFLASRRAAPPLPTLHNPMSQVMIDMVMRVDALEYEVAEQKKENALLAASVTSADTKADLALANQQWVTLREYSYLHQLDRQFPESAKKAFGTYLTGYCLEHGIPVRDMGIGDRHYKTEHGYHAELITQLLPGWLTRRQGQGHLLPLPKRTPRQTTWTPEEDAQMADILGSVAAKEALPHGP